MFIWLASYPKSGNTWLRIFLSNYCNEETEPTRLDDLLLGNQMHLSRHLFDETMGIISSELKAIEIERYRRLFHAEYVRKFEGTVFGKVHETFSSTFPSGDQCRVICIVRNPLDVAPSFAHHEGHTIDRIIQHMSNSDAHVDHGGAVFSEHIGSWSENVMGWACQDALEVLTIRYEDMVSAPEPTFAKIIEFSGLPHDQSKLEKALEYSRFDRLQAQEKATGFLERPQQAENFFRSGRSGSWEGALSERQVQQIISDHKSAMQMFGYL